MTDVTPTPTPAPSSYPSRLLRTLWTLEDHYAPLALAALGMVDLLTGARAGTDLDIAAITAGLAGVGVKVAGAKL